MTIPIRKKIAVLGSTGSVGRQALEVVKTNPDLFCAGVLTAWNNASLLVEQAIEHIPEAVVIGNEDHYTQVSNALSSLPIQVYAGEQSVCNVVSLTDVDLVVNAIVGLAGLSPTLNAIRNKKNIVLANKEALAVAGHIIMPLANEHGVEILPVDSEHSAIFQCLTGEEYNTVEKIILTASGGPFLGMNKSQLKQVTIAEALDHPNWSMGNKTTIDSATMMNKGLEMIGAKWLFRLQPDQIEVVLHPQSVIHSVVQFTDASMKAQIGLPDMRQPILFALGYPRRMPSNYQRFSFADYQELTFRVVDPGMFECLDMASLALHKGGNAPCVLNAANEVAVSGFLDGSIRFLDIPAVIRKCTGEMPFANIRSPEEIVQCDRDTRTMAREMIKTISSCCR